MATIGPSGLTVYRGPSQLDGAPVIGVITLNSGNPKTGNMAQLWILREDVAPSKAIRTGDDASVCGDCPLRALTATGDSQIRRCYVNPMGPHVVWRSYQFGHYPAATPDLLSDNLSGRMLRLGAYGDPAALPLYVVNNLTAYAKGWTGYTHAWRKLSRGWSAFVMASADSAADRVLANSYGYRSFRVLAIGETLRQGEIACPASPEAGHRTTCERCGLCNGSRANDKRKDIAIVAHGAAAKRFIQVTEVAHA